MSNQNIQTRTGQFQPPIPRQNQPSQQQSQSQQRININNNPFNPTQPLVTPIQYHNTDFSFQPIPLTAHINTNQFNKNNIHIGQNIGNNHFLPKNINFNPQIPSQPQSQYPQTNISNNYHNQAQSHVVPSSTTFIPPLEANISNTFAAKFQKKDHIDTPNPHNDAKNAPNNKYGSETPVLTNSASNDGLFEEVLLSGVVLDFSFSNLNSNLNCVNPLNNLGHCSDITTTNGSLDTINVNNMEREGCSDGGSLQSDCSIVSVENNHQNRISRTNSDINSNLNPNFGISSSINSLHSINIPQNSKTRNSPRNSPTFPIEENITKTLHSPGPTTASANSPNPTISHENSPTQFLNCETPLSFSGTMAPTRGGDINRQTQGGYGAHTQGGGYVSQHSSSLHSAVDINPTKTNNGVINGAQCNNQRGVVNIQAGAGSGPILSINGNGGGGGKSDKMIKNINEKMNKNTNLKTFVPLFPGADFFISTPQIQGNTSTQLIDTIPLQQLPPAIKIRPTGAVIGGVNGNNDGNCQKGVEKGGNDGNYGGNDTGLDFGMDNNVGSNFEKNNSNLNGDFFVNKNDDEEDKIPSPTCNEIDLNASLRYDGTTTSDNYFSDEDGSENNDFLGVNFGDKNNNFGNNFNHFEHFDQNNDNNNGYLLHYHYNQDGYGYQSVKSTPNTQFNDQHKDNNNNNTQNEEHFSEKNLNLQNKNNNPQLSRNNNITTADQHYDIMVDRVNDVLNNNNNNKDEKTEKTEKKNNNIQINFSRFITFDSFFDENNENDSKNNEQNSTHNNHHDSIPISDTSSLNNLNNHHNRNNHNVNKYEDKNDKKNDTENQNFHPNSNQKNTHYNSTEHEMESKLIQCEIFLSLLQQTYVKSLQDRYNHLINSSNLPPSDPEYENYKKKTLKILFFSINNLQVQKMIVFDNQSQQFSLNPTWSYATPTVTRNVHHHPTQIQSTHRTPQNSNQYSSAHTFSDYPASEYKNSSDYSTSEPKNDNPDHFGDYYPTPCSKNFGDYFVQGKTHGIMPFPDQANQTRQNSQDSYGNIQDNERYNKVGQKLSNNSIKNNKKSTNTSSDDDITCNKYSYMNGGNGGINNRDVGDGSVESHKNIKMNHNTDNTNNTNNIDTNPVNYTTNRHRIARVQDRNTKRPVGVGKVDNTDPLTTNSRDASGVVKHNNGDRNGIGGNGIDGVNSGLNKGVNYPNGSRLPHDDIAKAGITGGNGNNSSSDRLNKKRVAVTQDIGDENGTILRNKNDQKGQKLTPNVNMTLYLNNNSYLNQNVQLGVDSVDNNRFNQSKSDFPTNDQNTTSALRPRRSTRGGQSGGQNTGDVFDFVVQPEFAPYPVSGAGRGRKKRAVQEQINADKLLAAQNQAAQNAMNLNRGNGWGGLSKNNQQNDNNNNNNNNNSQDDILFPSLPNDGETNPFRHYPSANPPALPPINPLPQGDNNNDGNTKNITNFDQNDYNDLDTFITQQLTSQLIGVIRQLERNNNPIENAKKSELLDELNSLLLDEEECVVNSIKSNIVTQRDKADALLELSTLREGQLKGLVTVDDDGDGDENWNGGDINNMDNIDIIRGIILDGCNQEEGEEEEELYRVVGGKDDDYYNKDIDINNNNNINTNKDNKGNLLLLLNGIKMNQNNRNKNKNNTNINFAIKKNNNTIGRICSTLFIILATCLILAPIFLDLTLIFNINDDVNGIDGINHFNNNQNNNHGNTVIQHNEMYNLGNYVQNDGDDGDDDDDDGGLLSDKNNNNENNNNEQNNNTPTTSIVFEYVRDQLDQVLLSDIQTVIHYSTPKQPKKHQNKIEMRKNLKILKNSILGYFFLIWNMIISPFLILILLEKMSLLNPLKRFLGLPVLTPETYAIVNSLEMTHDGVIRVKTGGTVGRMSKGGDGRDGGDGGDNHNANFEPKNNNNQNNNSQNNEKNDENTSDSFSQLQEQQSDDDNNIHNFDAQNTPDFEHFDKNIQSCHQNDHNCHNGCNNDSILNPLGGGHLPIQVAVCISPE